MGDINIWHYILMLWFVLIEGLLACVTGWWPLLTITFLKWVVRKLLRKNSCILGLHYWEYEEKRYKCTGVKDIDHIDAIIRKCTGKCGRKQYSTHRPWTAMFKGWTEGELKEPIKLRVL